MIDDPPSSSTIVGRNGIGIEVLNPLHIVIKFNNNNNNNIN